MLHLLQIWKKWEKIIYRDNYYTCVGESNTWGSRVHDISYDFLSKNN